MLTFEQLVQDVGRWSKANFEDTYTDELPLKVDFCPGTANVQAGLGSVAPLLGIGEEIGELNEAVEADNRELIIDSIGDILIYLLDWCYREELSFPTDYSADECDTDSDGILNALSTAYGKMCHGKLKRCQKIRGMDNGVVYLEHMRKAMHKLVCCLAAYVESYISFEDNEVYLINIANDTWTNVVSKRTWKTWSRTGVADG